MNQTTPPATKREECAISPGRRQRQDARCTILYSHPSADNTLPASKQRAGATG